ncbi:CDIF630_02480 family spore surface protein [Clostridium thermarum]|uniref:CDIF630_02480 family spore surface protein n=1 Tax=Clostridium thermarum TaxID=1716543 RepID=UPI0013D38142|nr:DUF3787 domain-containing protein [Clostridium thermarum]
MVKNKTKEKFMAVPIERHDTAAWDNAVETKPVSRVAIPGEEDVRDAKDYVDANQK